MVDREHIEETLALIPGVLSARVVGDAGDPSEIHILAGSERHPKQIARDVESCLAAKFDLIVDHRRISIAQMEPVQESEVRLVLESVTLKLQGNRTQAEVSLRLGESLFVGRAEGAASARHRLLLVAKAAADGVLQAISEPIAVIVEDIGRFEVGRQPVVACVVTLAEARGEEALVGSAYVRRDEAEAAVRAVLAALNRRLGLLFEEAKVPA